MAGEAQRIIALSLGKICTSRNRRSGVDLCRNLLVSGVLQQARNTFMVESYRAAVRARTDYEHRQREIRDENEQVVDNNVSTFHSDSSRVIVQDEPSLCSSNTGYWSSFHPAADNVGQTTCSSIDSVVHQPLYHQNFQDSDINSDYNANHTTCPEYPSSTSDKENNPPPLSDDSGSSADDEEEGKDQGTTTTLLLPMSLDCHEHFQDDMRSSCDLLQPVISASSNTVDNFRHCSKRRLADEGLDNSSENAAVGEQCSLKRFRTSTSPSCVVQTSASPPESSALVQSNALRRPEPCQISNLVNIFNNGLSGFTNNVNNNNSNVISSNLSASSSGNSRSKPRTESALIACSSLMKDGFDRLARPMLAVVMTV